MAESKLRNNRETDFSDDGSSSGGDEEEWLDVEPEEDEPVAVISLLDDTVFPDVKSMLAYCKEKHGFDFLATRQRLGLDFHGTVKLVNYSPSRPNPDTRPPASDASMSESLGLPILCANLNPSPATCPRWQSPSRNHHAGGDWGRPVPKTRRRR